MKKPKKTAEAMAAELFAAKTDPLVLTAPVPESPASAASIEPATPASGDIQSTRPPGPVNLMLRITPELCYWLDQEAKRRSESSWKRVTTQQVILEFCVEARQKQAKAVMP